MPFLAKLPLSKGPLYHLIWIFVYSLVILAINRHFSHFCQCVHFWTHLLLSSFWRASRNIMMKTEKEKTVWTITQAFTSWMGLLNFPSVKEFQWKPACKNWVFWSLAKVNRVLVFWSSYWQCRLSMFSIRFLHVIPVRKINKMNKVKTININNKTIEKKTAWGFPIQAWRIEKSLQFKQCKLNSNSINE